MHNRAIVWFHFHLCILMTFPPRAGIRLATSDWLSNYWLKSQQIKHTYHTLTQVNRSNVNIQFGTKRAHQETKHVANKNNGLETSCKAKKTIKKSIFLWKLQPFWLFPHSLGAIKSLMSLCAAQMVVNHIWDLPPSERRENNGRPNEADFSDHRNQSHRWRRVTHPLWRSRRCRRSPAVWSGFLRSHAERSPGTRRPTCRNPTPWRRLHEDTEWPSF